MGSSNCEASHLDPRPTVPYGEQNEKDSLWFEEGYKECVGYLTEGRSLVFERHGFALENPGHNIPLLVVGRASEDHADIKHRWVIHYTEDEESQIFKISSALDGRWVGRAGRLLPASHGHEAAGVKITFLGNGLGYELEYADGDSMLYGAMGGAMGEVMNDQKTMRLQDRGIKLGFDVWSVTYR